MKKKQGIAINYTKEIFKDFLEKENIDIVCNAIRAYSQGEMDFSGFSLTRIENLTNQDLYHFGWNIWNHFKVTDQLKMAEFLKAVFTESLNNIEIKSIKSRLKDNEKEGKIIIREEL